jgi:hypothetical protein
MEAEAIIINKSRKELLSHSFRLLEPYSGSIQSKIFTYIGKLNI